MFIRCILLAVALFNSSLLLAADELIVYSSRKEHLLKPLFDEFSRQTGSKIRYITDQAAPLIARLKAEGTASPADLLITVDAGNLWQAAELKLLKPLESAVLTKNIPAHLKDPENRWFGLSIRARTVAYNNQKVKPEELSTYAALANPKWKGRLCLRTSKKVYNQSLVAMMIAHHGEEAAESIVKGWVKNLALPPFANDTQALKAVATGRCDVTIVNSYYYGKLIQEEKSLPLKLFWPDQQGNGVHVNISGGGIVAKKTIKPAAKKLLEWLSSDSAQVMLTDLNMEYPVNPTTQMAGLVQSWGSFKSDKLNVAKAGEFQAKAVKLMDRAGYR